MPPAEWTPELEQWLHQKALDAGFDSAGIAPVASPPASADALTAERFAAWIDLGHAGDMDYLKRRDPHGVLLRGDIHTAIPWARSIIVCAFNYNVSAPLSTDMAPEGTGWIARYAWSGSEPATQRLSDPQEECGAVMAYPNPSTLPDAPDDSRSEGSAPHLQPTDYHHELLTRLQTLESALQQKHPCQTCCYVDTGPLIERAAAARAGIGWIGKNTCVLNQRLGSWILLAVIVTSLPVAEALTLEAASDRCGSCTRCLDACPTAALIAPRVMDASRCIAYLTIEKKGSIPEDLRPLIGRQVFGCDICQDVCPWNRRAPVSAKPGMLPRAELINPPLDWLASMDADAFRLYFKGSPLERTRRKRLLRNVAIAMGNSGQQRFLPLLQDWSTAPEDPILAEAAQWAMHQLKQQRSAVGPPTLLASL